MELTEIRQHLDRIDTALIYILAERMSLIPKVAQYKAENNVPRYQPEREAQIIAAKREIAIKLNINPDFAEKIFKVIIEEAHVIEEKIIQSHKEAIAVGNNSKNIHTNLDNHK